MRIRCYVFFVFICVISVTGFAQKPPAALGSIPLSDLKMTSYEKDTTAEAVVLFDWGHTYLEAKKVITDEGNYTVTRIKVETTEKRHVRIKVLKSGGTRWADISIPVFSFDNIVFKGSTHNLVDGRPVETRITDDGKFSENVVTGVRLFKIALPNVRVGSIIDYSYTLTGDGERLKDWRFQRVIPTMHSEFWTVIPESIVFQTFVQGELPLSKYEEKPSSAQGDVNATAYHWVMNDIPAYQPEPFMPPKSFIESKVSISLKSYAFPGFTPRIVMGSWQDFAKTLNGSTTFGQVVRQSFFVTKKTQEIVESITEPLKKAEAIYNFVRDNFGWDNTYRYYPNGDLKKCWNEKRGSSADINVILASMMIKADIDAELILISTRDHGILRSDFPERSQANSLVCKINVAGRDYFLDATDRYTPMDMLPPNSLNGYGVVISKNPRFVELKSNRKTVKYVSAEILIPTDGDVSAKFSTTYEGYEAHKIREKFHDIDRSEMLSKLSQQNNWTVDSSEVTDLENHKMPVKTIFSVKLRESMADVYYLNPFIGDKVDGNPFKSSVRAFPVDFGNLSETRYFAKIVVPEGYVIDEVPKSIILKLPDNSVRYVYNTTSSNGLITVTSSLIVAKTSFTQSEYPHLREFYSQVLAKQDEQIVIKKK